MSKSNQLPGSRTAAKPNSRRGPHILSSILFLAAVGFAIGAVYLYWQEQQDDSSAPTPPPAVSGQYTLADVKRGLDEAGMSTDYGRNAGNANQLGSTPGQTLKANDNDVVVFIYSGSESGGQESQDMAAEAFAGMDASTLQVTRMSGEQIGAGEEAHIVQSSNVIVVMFGGSEEDVEQFTAGIQSLT